MKPVFFATPERFGAWLEEHHETATELLVGFYKKGSGRPSITWPESVEQALRFGWIDGVRRRVDDERYTIRFTPRKPGSNWSRVNLAKIEALRAAGRMHPAGEAAWAARRSDREGVYSFEQRAHARLDAEQEAAFRADRSAWEWFQAQAPSYRRTALHWVTSAKRPETRARRLATLIADSAAGRRIGPLRRS
jgi:uncharacterized protein YdeI (YjbR/CyaY-like superfamily)